MNQKLAIALIKRAGYSVHPVENGIKAIETLKQSTYNLILMDVQMPEMNGFEATKAIRQMEGEKKHIPIVAMTAHAMKGDKERCLKAGMDDYIAKPIEPQELFDTIEKWSKNYCREKVKTKKDDYKKKKTEKNIPIEFETAVDRFCGDRELLENMLEEFLDYVPKQLRTLDKAIKKGDAETVDREAHSLKGLAAQLSVKGLADLSLNLELLGQKGNLDEANDELDKLKTEFQHLKEYINNSLHHEITVNS